MRLNTKKLRSLFIATLRKPALLIAVLIAGLSLAVSGIPTSLPVAQAQSGPGWQPVNHREAERYWAQMRGDLTPAVLAAARAKAATLPQANRLPPSNQRQGNSPRTNQPPSYSWRLL